jgi:external thioesterase TEII
MDHGVFQCIKKGKTSRQLICFPYLGGYVNSFLPLANILSENIEVWSLNLPGHGVSNQKPLKDIFSVLDLCFQLLQTTIKSDYVFFGHSMGGIIAYFLAHRILGSQQYPIKPSCLVLSACSVPTEFATKNYSNLSDADLLEQLLSYDGTPEELIQEKSLLEHFLPIFRADFEILESSASCEFKPLDIPAYFLWGETDKIVSIDTCLKWSKYFLRDLKLVPVPNGSHLFVHDQRHWVANQLQNIIDEVLN